MHDVNLKLSEQLRDGYIQVQIEKEKLQANMKRAGELDPNQEF